MSASAMTVLVGSEESTNYLWRNLGFSSSLDGVVLNPRRLGVESFQLENSCRDRTVIATDQRVINDSLSSVSLQVGIIRCILRFMHS